MVTIKTKQGTYELSTSLKTVYALKDIAGAKTLQEAMSCLKNLDFDGQLDLIYAAFKATNPEMVVKKSDFINDILESNGVYALTNVISKITDGILYAGLSDEELAAKKAEAEAAVQGQKQAGQSSSVSDIE